MHTVQIGSCAPVTILKLSDQMDLMVCAEPTKIAIEILLIVVQSRNFFPSLLYQCLLFVDVL